MKDMLTALVMLLTMAGVEGALWVRNPMHVPEGFLPARAFGIQLFDELDASMEPAVAVGHKVLVTSWPYWWSEPQVGDVVAFVYPRDAAIADLKRIVAAGGAMIEVREGTLYIDGKPQGEPYAQGLVSRFNRMTPARRIPLGSYFVMGDNSAISEDSRIYGLITRDRIIGKRWF